MERPDPDTCAVTEARSAAVPARSSGDVTMAAFGQGTLAGVMVGAAAALWFMGTNGSNYAGAPIVLAYAAVLGAVVGASCGLAVGAALALVRSRRSARAERLAAATAAAFVSAVLALLLIRPYAGALGWWAAAGVAAAGAIAAWRAPSIAHGSESPEDPPWPTIA